MTQNYNNSGLPSGNKKCSQRIEQKKIDFDVTKTFVHLDLLTPCWGQGIEGGPNVPNYPVHGSSETLNIMLESTYDFITELYREIQTTFPEEFVHLGMDEAYDACWLA